MTPVSPAIANLSSLVCDALERFGERFAPGTRDQITDYVFESSPLTTLMERLALEVERITRGLSDSAADAREQREQMSANLATVFWETLDRLGESGDAYQAELEADEADELEDEPCSCACGHKKG